MNTLYERLMADHRNLEAVLKVLEQGIGRYGIETDDPESEPSIPLIMEILDYVHFYPEYVHHPLEEAAMDHLQDLGLWDGKQMEQIRQDHHQLEHESETVRELVQAISVGSPVSLEQLHTELDDWIAHQRRHIQREEESLFLAIEQLSQADCDRIESRVEHRSDPVFGSQTSSQFDTLLAEVEAL